MPLSFRGVYLIFLTKGFVWIGVRVEEMRIQEHAGISCKEQHIFGSGECGEEELPDRTQLKTHLKKHLECGTPPELLFHASPSTAFELLKMQGMPGMGGQRNRGVWSTYMNPELISELFSGWISGFQDLP
jgi:hypothetical protein